MLVFLIGCILFIYLSSIEEPTFFINNENFKKRNFVYDAFLKNNKIYVACGNEGLDIYKYKDGHL